MPLYPQPIIRINIPDFFQYPKQMRKSFSFYVHNHPFSIVNFHHFVKVIPLSILLFLNGMDISAQKKAPVSKPKSVKATTHQDIFNEKMTLAQARNMAEGVLLFGQSFIGNAYPKSNIDTTKRADGKIKLQLYSKEVLVVNLKIFDCVTFIESMIALTQTRHSKTPNYETFKNNIRRIRYRNGEIDYATRLHYFSDWLYENEKRGILKNITAEIGGEVYDKPIFYMTYKKDTLYGNLSDPTTFNRMKKVEEDITHRTKYYIPKNQVANIESQIKNGDIIAITNRLEGMDMAHTGIALWQNNRLHMLHASSQFRQVVVTDVPLVDYLARNKGQTGIMVARLND